MKSNINVKGSTFVATVAGLLIAGASIVSFTTTDRNNVKLISFNLGLLGLGVTVGSVGASHLMTTKLLDEEERVTNKFTDEIKELDRANTEFKLRLDKLNSKLSEREVKVKTIKDSA